jgi:hypothetical protein
VTASPDREISAAAEWLRDQAKGVPFGEVGVTLVLHAGRLVRMERTVREKTQPTVEKSHS